MCLKNDDSVMKNNLYIQYKYFCDSEINIILYRPRKALDAASSKLS